jgi:hypothetical protein
MAIISWNDISFGLRVNFKCSFQLHVYDCIVKIGGIEVAVGELITIGQFVV